MMWCISHRIPYREVTSAVPDLVLVLKNMFAWIEVMRTFVPAYARTTSVATLH